MEKTISSDFIRGHIDTIILKSLFDGSKHALEISAYIEEKSRNQYEVKQATLYSALKRLETKKYVRPFWNDAPEGGRRRYFEATQAGLDYANKTLSEWDYSRDIIDTLIDETPNNKIHSPTTEIIKEKKSDLDAVSENKQEVQPIIIVQKTVDSDDKNENKTEIVKETQPVLEKQIETEKTEKVVSSTETVEQKNKYDEINYKQILGELFNFVQKPADKAQNDEKTEESEKLEDLNTEKVEEKTFDDDLLTKPQKTGKIDFSDLIEKAESEGYKIRISSNKTEKIGGKILINKANLISSLFVFLLTLIELLALSLIYKKYDIFNPVWYFVGIAVFAVYPVISIINYIKSPQKTINRYNQNLVVTVSVICINLLFFIIAIVLLNDIKFNSAYQVAVRLVIPIIVVFNVFLIFFIKHLIVKSKNLITKK